MRITLPENITEHWLWSEPVRFQWWLLLLQKAMEGPCEVVKHGKTFHREVGELITSRDELARMFGVSRDVARNFLRQLEEHGEIDRPKVDPKLTHLTICKINGYIESRPKVDPKLTQSDEFTEVRPKVDPKLTHLKDCDTDISGEVRPKVDPKLTQKEKEKRNEKESFPPHPLYKEKENKKEKEEGEFTDVNSTSSGGADDALAVGIDFKRLVQFFNEKMQGKLIKQIRRMPDHRKKAVRCRAQTYGKEAVMQVIVKASESTFLNGNNKQNFVASFDWMFRPMNFLKVLEGNYDNKTNLPTLTTTPQPNGRTYGYRPTASESKQQRDDEFAKHIAAKLAKSKHFGGSGGD